MFGIWMYSTRLKLYTSHTPNFRSFHIYYMQMYFIFTAIHFILGPYHSFYEMQTTEEMTGCVSMRIWICKIGICVTVFIKQNHSCEYYNEQLKWCTFCQCWKRTAFNRNLSTKTQSTVQNFGIGDFPWLLLLVCDIKCSPGLSTMWTPFSVSVWCMKYIKCVQQ